MQVKLREQSLALAGRMQSRDLSTPMKSSTASRRTWQYGRGADGSCRRPAEGHELQGCVPQEQKALQYLLRAEATFRQIEVAFGRQGGGGGGGGGSAGRDLASLFDPQMDTEKNQYWTAVGVISG